MPNQMGHLAPITDDLLRMAVRALLLPAKPRVLDLCCGLGPASFLLAREFGANCIAVDANESLLRAARQQTLNEGLESCLEFKSGDARHVELPNGAFDLVLALGGALTYIGRTEGLERILQLLKPGGALLLSDLVYLDSPVPAEVEEAIVARAPGNETRSLELEPAVRAVFEEGVYRFETEESYRVLLHAVGYATEFAFPVPESAWNTYYRSAVLSSADPPSEFRIPVEPDELASYYCWGGRWGIAYLVCGARVRGAGGDREG